MAATLVSGVALSRPSHGFEAENHHGETQSGHELRAPNRPDRTEMQAIARKSDRLDVIVD